MRLLPCLALLLLTFSFNAQAPAPPKAVAIKDEPHHHLVFENDYVRVFRVHIPAHDATLLHQHDVPYLYVSLGPADVINAVQGRPEARIVMTDGQLGYSLGHFAHIARTDAGSTFDNVTVELLHPQGEPRNTCAEIVPGISELHCDSPAASKARWLDTVSQFQTDEMEVSLTRVDPNADQTTFTADAGNLFVLVRGSGIQTVVKGKPEETLVVGDVRWLLAGSNTTFSNPHQEGWSYLTLAFKRSGSPDKF